MKKLDLNRYLGPQIWIVRENSIDRSTNSGVFDMAHYDDLVEGEDPEMVAHVRFTPPNAKGNFDKSILKAGALVQYDAAGGEMTVMGLTTEAARKDYKRVLARLGIKEADTN
jgi:hypothetical protein